MYIKNIKLEILESSYYEHFKYTKDIAMFYPLNHPKRLELDIIMNSMLKEIHLIRNTN